MAYAEKDIVATLNDLLPESAGPETTPEELQYLDQYHAGGFEAVQRVMNSLNLSPSDRVLDVGSGFGGPARQIAQATGCSVTGVDITDAYVEAAIELTNRCGLSDRVRFVHTDIATFVPERPFDAGLTMHVQMNIEAKREWFGEIAKRLAPGARFAVWEVCRTSDAEPLLPLPWSIDGIDSYVDTSDNLCAAVVDAGFQLIEWIDESAWVNSWFEAILADGLPPGPTLPVLLEDGYSRTFNFASAVAHGILGVRRGAFVRGAAPYVNQKEIS